MSTGTMAFTGQSKSLHNKEFFSLDIISRENHLVLRDGLLTFGKFGQKPTKAVHDVICWEFSPNIHNSVSER